MIRIDPEVTGVTRDDLIERLREAGVGTSVHFIPLHLHSYYRDTFGYRPEHFPVATRAADRILSLPFYPDMLEADVEYVAETLTRLVRRAMR